MATLDQLSSALQNADAAGDTDAARTLAAEIVKMRQPQGFVANAMDFAKSIPRGILQGAGNFGSMLAGAGDPDVMSAMAWSGQDPVGAVKAGKEATEQAVTGGINKAQETTGAFPEPQGRAGKVGAAIGEGLGNPLSYIGPGGLPLKIGGAVLSSAGSEGAGQAAEGTQFETPARLAGALLGGATAAKTFGAAAPKAAVPTASELFNAGRQGYKTARESGLELHPEGVASWAQKTEQELLGPDHGFTGGKGGVAPKTLGVLDTLQRPPEGAVITAANLDALRKNLGRIAEETQPAQGGFAKSTPDAAAASVTLKRLNDYTEAIPSDHVLAGLPENYLRAIKQANADWAAGTRVRDFDTRLTKAENATDRQVAGSLDSQIKIKAGQLLDNQQKMRGLVDAEKQQLQLVNSGGPVSNTLRQAGRGGAGVIPIMTHLAAAPGVFALGGPMAIAAQAGGAALLYGARKGSEAITKNRAQKLAEMLAKRSPEYERRAASLPSPDNSASAAALARALLAH